MAPQTKPENHTSRLNHLEYIQSKQLTGMKDLMSKFAWYWLNERQKLFSVVTRITKDKADMVVFNADWSGGVSIIDGSSLLVRLPGVPDDELMKEGKWEPFLTLDEVIAEELNVEEEPDEEKAKLFGNKKDAS